MGMNWMKASAPYVSMVVAQLAYAGSNILCKLALERGLSLLVFIVYRHLIALLILAPLAYVLERNKRPALSFSVVLRIFLLALLGITVQQNVYYAGLDFTSPTFAIALCNVMPAFTFILAIFFGMEKVSIWSAKGRAGLVGTVFCIGGALIFTFWKGLLLGGFVQSPLIRVHAKGPKKGGQDWLKGSALILTSAITNSAWLVLQAFIYKIYPASLSMNTLMCFFATLQSSALALIFERNASSWRMNWNIRLLAIFYCGTVISGLTYYLQTYCISEKGPVFAAISTPLGMLIVGFISAFIFTERLHVGSLIGAFIIVVGLYCVLWGKVRDSSAESDDKNSEAQSNSTGDAEKNVCRVQRIRCIKE